MIFARNPSRKAENFQNHQCVAWQFTWLGLIAGSLGTFSASHQLHTRALLNCLPPQGPLSPVSLPSKPSRQPLPSSTLYQQLYQQCVRGPLFFYNTLPKATAHFQSHSHILDFCCRSTPFLVPKSVERVREGNHPSWTPQYLCDQILGVTSHPFCHILLVRSESLGPTCTQRQARRAWLVGGGGSPGPPTGLWTPDQLTAQQLVG